jgi:hypothetical protein
MTKTRNPNLRIAVIYRLGNQAQNNSAQQSDFMLQFVVPGGQPPQGFFG